MEYASIGKRLMKLSVSDISPFRYRGVFDGIRKRYSMDQKQHLISALGKWGGNLYVWQLHSWATSIKDAKDEEVESMRKLTTLADQTNVRIWYSVKPGDWRYCLHRSDRKILIENCERFIRAGADGIYLQMDDMHPNDRISVKDAVYHAKLIKELHEQCGDRFKGICGQQYHGVSLKPMDYWGPIMEEMPEEALLTWTGPHKWCRKLKAADIPEFGRPLLLWDNYFANRAVDPAKVCIKPYHGRSPDLASAVSGILINAHYYYPWSYTMIRTSMDYLVNPKVYNPEVSFRNAVMELGEEKFRKDWT